MAGVEVYPPGQPVPATDSTNNVFSSDVIGSKADTPPATSTAANSTLSLAAYIKALWNLLRTLAGTLALQATTTETGADSISGSAGGTIRQLVASSAGAIRRITISGDFNNNTNGNPGVTIDVYKGPGGSETLLGTTPISVVGATLQGWFTISIQVNLASGTRVAWKPTVASGTANVAINYVIEEA